LRTSLKTLALATALLLSACSLFQEEEALDVEAAQAQFCTDVEDYVAAIGEYGGLFEEVTVTVGDVRNAADALAPGREAVTESGQAFQEAVEAENASGVTIDLVEPESIEAVEAAEEAFAAATDVEDRTTVADAGVEFTSAAYALEVAWVRLFVDAGCIAEEDEAQAKQWVSDYVTALQTDLAAAGLYSGRIDGIYGPETIDAVERLQGDAGLPVTGLMDPATQTALNGLLGLRDSAQVGALQGILISTGYYDGEVDGQWSTEVEDALKALQTDLGVPATGVVDADTLRAFEAALAEAGQPPVTTTTQPGPAPTEPPPATTVPPPPEPTTTVAPEPEPGVLEVLAEAGQFTQLLAGIETAGLTDMLSGPGPFTLFAPTDAAITAAGGLPADTAALTDLLLYHVVEEDLDAFQLVEAETVVTVQGSEIAVTVVDGLIRLNDAATVSVSNVIGGNGRAHVVNAVLAPPA
jgi:peptidoglycan hydrolase-like protein with peptidoglycan-binding domain